MSNDRVWTTGFISLVLVLTSTWLVADREEAQPLTALVPNLSDPAPVTDVASVRELEEIFRELDYDWPVRPDRPIPHIYLERFPPDFDVAADVHYKKALFLRTVLPLVLAENQRLREQRSLAALLWDYPLPAPGHPLRRWADRIAAKYGVTMRDGWDRKIQRERLLARLDGLPVKLVLAQAAIESGWGTSRFAREGNSIFGQWTFGGAGLVPAERDADASHQVKAFANLQASVRAYLYNINTSNAYRELRWLRARLRKEGRPPDAYTLAAGLHRYSQRGEDYVREVRRILRGRFFTGLDAVTLRPAPGLSTDG